MPYSLPTNYLHFEVGSGFGHNVNSTDIIDINQRIDIAQRIDLNQRLDINQNERPVAVKSEKAEGVGSGDSFVYDEGSGFDPRHEESSSFEARQEENSGYDPLRIHYQFSGPSPGHAGNDRGDVIVMETHQMQSFSSFQTDIYYPRK